VLAQLAGDREAILARQTEVQQHEGRRIAGHQRQQLAPVVHLADAEALHLQVIAQQLGDVDFIVEDGNVGQAHSAGASGGWRDGSENCNCRGGHAGASAHVFGGHNGSDERLRA